MEQKMIRIARRLARECIMAAEKTLGMVNVFVMSGEMSKSQGKKLKSLVCSALAVHYRKFLSPDIESAITRKGGKVPDGSSRSRDIRRGPSLSRKDSTH
jgi:hypothetical protein